MHKNNSTYSLLVRSEEKSRTILETVVYALFIVSAVVSIWQFAQQRVVVPGTGVAPYVASTNVVDQVRG